MYKLGIMELGIWIEIYGIASSFPSMVRSVRSAWSKRPNECPIALDKPMR